MRPPTEASPHCRGGGRSCARIGCARPAILPEPATPRSTRRWRDYVACALCRAIESPSQRAVPLDSCCWMRSTANYCVRGHAQTPIEAISRATALHRVLVVAQLNAFIAEIDGWFGFAVHAKSPNLLYLN